MRTQHLARLILPATITAFAFCLIAAPANATEPTDDTIVTEWHTWNVPGGVLTDEPQDANDVTWPQTYAGPGLIAPAVCGEWTQQDRYEGTRAQIDQVLADGQLTYGEDFHLTKEWHFAYAGDCPVIPEKPTPETTVVPVDSLDCDLRTVTTVTTTALTDWVLVENVWVKTEPVITTETTSRPATEQECPTVVPPVVEPPVVEPPVVTPPVVEPPVIEPPVTEPTVVDPPVVETPVSEPVPAVQIATAPVAERAELAATGGDMDFPFLFLGAGLLLAGASLVTIRVFAGHRR